jgi:hypothetical protein
MTIAFISYSRQSQAMVKTLAQDIEALGPTVWFDQEISGGRSWWEQILAELRRCDVFIFALDSQALNSTACKREYEYAAALGKPILPILISDDVSPDLLPSALSQIQFIDYRVQDRQSGIRLAKALNSIPPAPPLPDPLPDPPPVPVSYLASLTERVESPSTLSYEEQTLLLADLRRSLRDPATADDTRHLLDMLRQRRDFLAVFAEEVEELRTSGRPVPLVNDASNVALKALNVGKDYTKSWARKDPRRFIHPQTRLGAALRGALVGLALSILKSVVRTVASIRIYGDDNSLFPLLLFCTTAGAIAGRSWRASLAALVLVCATMITTIPFESGNVVWYLVVLGTLTANVAALLIVLWEKIRG